MAAFRIYTTDTTQETLEALWPGAGIAESGRRADEQAWLVEMDEDPGYMEYLFAGADVVIHYDLLDDGDDEDEEDE